MECEICGKDILKDSQCIDYKYYHNDCIINLIKENQELNKQLEEINKFKFSYKKDQTKIPPIIRKQKDVEIIKNLENQQKEFIEYLEEQIKDMEEEIGNSITKPYKESHIIRKNVYQEILSKYKENNRRY